MKCDSCHREIYHYVYGWKGFSPVYCSPSCAAWGCPNAMLESERVEEVEKK